MAHSEAYGSNVEQWPTVSYSKSLKADTTQIRLIRLQDDQDTENLSYSIHYTDVSRSKDVKFSALSYAWGAIVPTKSLKRIIVDGESILVRPTLHALLKTLAIHGIRSDLWVDVLCINQIDVDERNRQVVLMRDIFREAERVYTWLGQGDDDTNYAIEHIENSDPRTPFELLQFCSSAEKLFLFSYWTRRWVMQEFALAQRLYIVCGLHVTTWPRIVEKVDKRVLQGNKHALETFERFKRVKLLGRHQDSTLLELMLQYKDSRCLDPRDKAIALKSLAKDGSRFVPDYNESVTDVFFRALSQQKTEKVLPEMVGYRWPHQAAYQLQQCLSMSKGDVLRSLHDKPTDVLYATFEYVGTTSSVSQLMMQGSSKGYKILQLSNQLTGPFHGSRNVNAGDLVYSLQSSPRSPRGLFIAFRPQLNRMVPTGLILGHYKASKYWQLWDMMEQIMLGGVERCFKNATSVSPMIRIMCHLSRAAMILLWLLDRDEEYELQSCDFSFISTNEDRLCRCHHNLPTEVKSEAIEDTAHHNYVEVLPTFERPSDKDYWAATRYGLWYGEAEKSSTDTSMNKASNTFQHDFYSHGKTDLSYATEDGFVLWTTYLLSTVQEDVDTIDEKGHTPLSLAIVGGHDEIVQFLLESDRFNMDPEDMKRRRLRSPLKWAIASEYTRGVEMLLLEDNVNPSIIEYNGTTALSSAVRGGNLRIVETLLASEKTDPDCQDEDGTTALLWAVTSGHEEIVKLFLSTDEVDCNMKDSKGRTPLARAAQLGFARIVELLLARDDIKPDIADNEGTTPLGLAAEHNKMQCFRLLANAKVMEDRKHERVVKQKHWYN